MQLFENNTYSVVNIFDVTLRPQLKMTGVVEVMFLNTKKNTSCMLLSIV